MAFSFLKPQSSYFNNIPFTFGEGFLMLLLQIPVAYLSIYFVWPMYWVERKVFKAIFWGVVVWASYYFVDLNLIRYWIPDILGAILPEKNLQYTERPHELTFYMNLLLVVLATFTTTVLAMGFKYIKQWYLKEQKNIQLQKENAESQLQLLTAQIHPHFLFNTLNNIYSQTQIESPRGSKMIMELSDMLRHILSEGGKPAVTLDSELNMIRDYINLERIRYGKLLDLHLAIPESSDLMIAPLILLPFVEKSFQQYSEAPRKPHWVSLTIRIDNDNLIMKLMCSQNPEKQNGSPVEMTNVMKRLELLYKDKYELQVSDEAESLIINLRMILDFAPRENQNTIKESSTTVYER